MKTKWVVPVFSFVALAAFVAITISLSRTKTTEDRLKAAVEEALGAWSEGITSSQYLKGMDCESRRDRNGRYQFCCLLFDSEWSIGKRNLIGFKVHSVHRASENQIRTINHERRVPGSPTYMVSVSLLFQVVPSDESYDKLYVCQEIEPGGLWSIKSYEAMKFNALIKSREITPDAE